MHRPASPFFRPPPPQVPPPVMKNAPVSPSLSTAQTTPRTMPKARSARSSRNAALILAGSIAALVTAPTAGAAILYWDSNGATPGAGTTPAGTWGASNFWTTDVLGTSATTAYTAGSDVVFSAGIDAVTTAITLTSTQTANSLTFEEGATTISGAGGQITLLGTGNTTVGTFFGSTASAFIGANTTTALGGTAGLTTLGFGTLTLNGSAVNTFTGGLNVNGGSLALDFANLATPTNLIDSGNALNFGGGILSLKGKASGSTSQSLGNVTLNAGGGQLLVNPNGGSGTTVTLGSLTGTVAGGSLLVGSAIGSGAGTAITTTTPMDATGIYGGRIVYGSGTAATGYDWATTTSGSSPYTLSAYSGYSPLTLTAGTDTVNSRITASQTLAGARITSSLKIENPAATQTLALGTNLLTLTNGGLLSTGTNATTISGTAGSTQLTAGNTSGAYDLVVHQFNTGGLTISAVIGDNVVGSTHATSLTKAGLGTLTLSGLDTYTGGTFVDAGTLVSSVNLAAASNNIKDASNIFIGSNGTLQLNGTNTTSGVTTIGHTITGTGLLKLNFNANGTARNTSMANITNFAGTIELANAGVNGDKLSNSNLSAPNATLVVDSGSQLYVTGGTDTLAAVRITGTGNNETLGAIRLQGTLAAPVTLTGNASIGSSNGTIAGPISAAGAFTLTMGTTNGTGTALLSGALGNGSGTLSLTNAFGTTTLSGANTYTGATAVSGGTLNLTSSLGATAISTSGTGVFSESSSGVIAGATSFTQGSSGTSILGGTNTYGGVTAINAGVLVFQTPGSLPNYTSHTANLVTVASGATASFGVGAGTSFSATDLGNLASGVIPITFSSGSYFGLDTTAATGGTATVSNNFTTLPASGGLVKTGAGTLLLTGTNSYGGLSQVNAGTLSYNGTGALPSGSQISLNGGTFQVLNDGAGTVTYGNTVGALTSSTFNVGNNGGATTGSTLAFGALLAPTTAAATNITLTFTGANSYGASFSSLSLAGVGGSGTTLIANAPVTIAGNVTNRITTLAVGNFDTLALQGTSTGMISGVIADASGGSSTAGGTTPVAKSGTGTWILSGLNTYQGTTSVTGGTLELLGATGAVGAGNGSLILKDSGSTNGSNAGTTVNTGATLAIFNNVIIGDGTTSAATNTGTLTVGNGSSGTLSLQDGTINGLTVHGSATTGATNFLTLGGAAGQVGIVNLDLGANATDQIFVTASAISGSGKLFVNTGGAVINLNQLALTSLTTGNSYTLLSYPAGETYTGVITLGTNTPGAGQVYTLSNTATAEILTVSAGAGATNVYYKGNVSNVLNAGSGTSSTNFTSDFANTTSTVLPDSTTNVFFTGSNATVANLNTTSGQAFAFNSLSFAGTGTAGTATSAANVVTIGGTNLITLNATAGFTDQNGTVYAAGVGLVDQVGVTVSHVISAPLALGASQSFEIDNVATAPLNISGAISGGFGLTKTGTGALLLGGANTFSGGLTIANGTVIANVSNATTVSGAAGPSTSTITLGAAASNNSASLLGNTFTVSNPVSLVAPGTGTLTIGNNLLATSPTFSGGIATNGVDFTIATTGTGTTTESGLIAGAGNLTVTNDVGASTTLTGSNTGFTGTVSLGAGILNANQATASNTFSTLGSGQINLSGGSLKVKDNAAASGSLIQTGNGTPAIISVTGTSTLDVNDNTANVSNGFVFGDLGINSSTLNVTGANNYEVLVGGTATLSGAATFNPTTAPLVFTGKLVDGGNAFTVSGTGLTRVLNTASGAGANSVSAGLTVSGGNLLGYAPASGGNATGVSSLGSDAITLSGTSPIIRVAPVLGTSLTNGTTAGLLNKSFAGPTSVGATNFLGATSAFAVTDPNPGTQTVANINFPAGGSATQGSQQFTGLLNITSAGMYNISDVTDDGALVTIDGVPVISVAGNTTVAGSIYLTSGLHAFSDRWNNSGNNPAAQVLSYQGLDTGNVLTVIPASAFSTANNAADLSPTFTNPITIATGVNGTVDIASNSTIGTVTFAGTGSTLTATGSSNIPVLTTGAIVTAGTSTLAPTTALLTTGSITGSAGGTDTIVLGGTATPNATYSIGNQASGVIANGAGGTLALTKNTSDTWVINGSGSNTYTGVTISSGGGLLTLAKTGGAIAIPGTINLDGSVNLTREEIGSVATAGTIGQQFGTGTVFNFVNNTSALHNYVKLFGNSQTIAGLSETVPLGGVVENSEQEAGVTANSILTINNSADYSFAGYLRSFFSGTGTTGTLGITKTGSGAQTLSGAQIIYTGPTTISAGRLELNGASAFVSNVTFDAGSTGTLQVDTATQGIGALNTVDATNSNAIVQNAAATSSVLTVTQATNTSFGGILRNNPVQTTPSTLGLTKAGAGTLTLAGANTYSGGTIVNAGILLLTGTNSSAGTVTVNNAGSILQLGNPTPGANGGMSSGLFTFGGSSTLQNTSGSAVTLTNALAVTSTSSTVLGTGSITTTGNTTFTSTKALINNITGPSTLTLATVDLGGGASTATIGGSGATIVNGAISNSTGTFTYNGTGSLTLNATSTYTGPTAISSGTVTLGNGGNLGATAVTVSGGTFAAKPGVNAATTALGASLNLAAGTAFTMADGATSTANVTGAGTLAPVSGTATTLTFDVNGAGSGAGFSDRLAIGGVGADGAGKATIFVNGLGTSAANGNVYTLITAASGLTTGNFTFGNVGGRVVFGATSYIGTLSGTGTSELLTLGGGNPTQLYWTGSQGSIWNTPSSGTTNWNTDETSGVNSGTIPTSVTDVFFTTSNPVATNLTNTLGANTTINSLNFTAASGAVTIGAGNTLTLFAGVTDLSANAQTVNAPVILSAPQTFSNTGAGLLTIGGGITDSGFLLTTAGSGSISLAALTGAGGLTTSGTGTTTLTGTSTYTGATTVAAGTTLSLTGTTGSGTGTAITSSGTFNESSTGVIAGTSNLTVSAGATTLAGVNTTAGTVTVGTATLNVASTGSFTQISSLNGSSNTGITNIAGNVTATSAGPNRLQGFYTQIAGAGSYKNFDLGDVAPSNATSYYLGGTGSILAASGQYGSMEVGGRGVSNFYLSGTGALTVTGTANPNNSTQAQLVVGSAYNTTNAGNGSGLFVQQGGTVTTNGLVLGATNNGTNGTNTTASPGVYYLNGGTLTTSTLTRGVVGATSPGTLNFGGGTFKSGTAFSTDANVVTNINAGGATIDTTGGNLVWSGNLLAGTVGNAGFTGLTGGSGYTTVPTVTVSAPPSGTTATAVAVLDQAGQVFDVIITNPGSGYTSAPTFTFTGGGFSTAATATGTFAAGPGGLTKTGSNTLTLSGNDTYTGGTIVNGGTLKAGAATHAFGANTGLLTVNTGGTVDLNGFGQQIGLLAGTGGTVLNNGAGSVNLNLLGSTGSASYQGVIADNNSGSGLILVNKAGAGTQILSGANTYSGGTQLSAGILQLGTGGTLGSVSGSLQVTGGTLDLSGNNLGVGILAGTGGTILNNATGTNQTLTVGNGIATGGSYAGVIADNSGGTGTLALTKTGNGTQTLTGMSTYTGATTVSSTGSLTVSGSLSGTTSVAVNNGGTLILSGTSETLGALTPSAPGSINNSASVSLGGHATLTSTLRLTGTAQTESVGALTLSQNSAIDLGAGTTANNLVFSSLTSYSGTNLNVVNWTGNYYDPSATTENGTASQDRLLFTADPGETFANSLSFYSDTGAFIGQGHDIAFGGAGGGYEIVAIPEPSTIYSGLLILGLAGYRERRRLRKLVPGLN